jgi:predicted nuclease with TOPRIM domain
MSYFFKNRFICDVLADMRKCNKTRNYAPMKALIEEAQMLANRMESAISIAKDIPKIEAEYEAARQKLKAIKKELPPEEEKGGE